MRKKVTEHIPTLIGFAIIFLLIALIIKLLLLDCIIGTKVYNENDIIIRYHRFTNVITVKNNSDSLIYFHYQSGVCRRDANRDKYYNDIINYKKSDSWEIAQKEKFTHWGGLGYDGYIFVVSNDDGLYDSSDYNKNNWFFGLPASLW